ASGSEVTVWSRRGGACPVPPGPGPVRGAAPGPVDRCDTAV
ncbi:MAG: hypothetical protein AVDCRST_MAG36-793, partial [uncultured Nocardioidaceae bacterium]